MFGGASFSGRGPKGSKVSQSRNQQGRSSGGSRGGSRRRKGWSGKSPQEDKEGTKWSTSHRGWKKHRDDKPRNRVPPRHEEEQQRRFPGEHVQHGGPRSGAGLDGKKKPQEKKSSSPMEWAHEAAVRSASHHGSSPLKRLSTRIPWRRSTGRSSLIHPLRGEEFWLEFFGRRAVVFRRGPHHPAMMTSSTAAGLMRQYKLAVNADIMGPHIWSPGGQTLRYGPERGLPAVVALARGKSVRLQMVHLRRRSLLRADPLIAAIARFSPGRGVGANLHWAPPKGQSIWEHQDWYHQIILQVYGVRNWTVCSRGLTPPNILPEDDTEDSEEGATAQRGRVAKCVTTILRRGDVLYLPANTWHWNSAGPKASAHLEMGVSPLVGADLVSALGVRHRVRDTPHRAFGIPLALWRHRNAVDAAELVRYQCLELPWLEPRRDHQAFCSQGSVSVGLARLSGSKGRMQAGWSGAADKPASGPMNEHIQRAREAKAARHKAGVLGPLADVLRPAGEVLGIIGVIFFLLWICAACAPSGTSEGGRSRYQAREARQLRRKLKSAASKKDD